MASGGAAPTTHCELCGRAAETSQVGFTRNIGAIFLNFSRTTHGNMCRFCVERYFWRYTVVSLLFGWWGVTSFFVNAVWVPINIACYLRCLGLPAPSDDARSLADRRRRGLGAMGCAVALAVAASAGVALGAWQMFGAAGGASTSGAVIVALAGGLLGVPALLVFGLGVWVYIKGRAKPD